MKMWKFRINTTVLFIHVVIIRFMEIVKFITVIFLRAGIYLLEIVWVPKIKVFIFKLYSLIGICRPNFIRTPWRMRRSLSISMKTPLVRFILYLRISLLFDTTLSYFGSECSIKLLIPGIYAANVYTSLIFIVLTKMT